MVLLEPPAGPITPRLSRGAARSPPESAHPPPLSPPGPKPGEVAPGPLGCGHSAAPRPRGPPGRRAVSSLSERGSPPPDKCHHPPRPCAHLQGPAPIHRSSCWGRDSRCPAGRAEPGEHPGGPVVTTPGFRGHGPGSIPDLGTPASRVPENRAPVGVTAAEGTQQPHLRGPGASESVQPGMHGPSRLSDHDCQSEFPKFFKVSLSDTILRARVLECVATPGSRRSS